MKKKNCVLGMLVFMVLMIVLTACGGSTGDKGYPKDTKAVSHIAVILGSHNNAPKVNLGLIEEQVYEACFSYGSITLICDDGAPYSYVVDIPRQKEGLSEGKYISIANKQTKEILDAASMMTAKTEQVNTLKAVQLGIRSLNSIDEESDGADVSRRMVILDSCLSTTGALDFTKSHLEGISPDNIVDQLDELGEIPDMSMLDEVTVYTCGDTAGKQTVLTEANRETLKGVWQAIFRAGGVTANMKDDLPLSGVYDTDALPAVNTVTVEQDSVDITSEDEAESVLETGVVISFPETSIAFKPGTAELADPGAAQKSLEHVIGFLVSHPDFELLVCGTTACWGGESYCRDLSGRRAGAIRDLLIENGIAGDRLRVAGVGYSFSDFYTYDQTENGELDESIAPLNRTVKIMDLHSETAERVLAVC